MESGLHFCFVAPDRKSVDAFHAAALKTGGKDNGKPGVRADYSPKYYAAFVIDPDGYRTRGLLREVGGGLAQPASSMISPMRRPSVSIVNGFVSSCMPGASWPLPMMAFSA